MRGDHHRRLAVGEVVDGFPHHLPGHVQGMMLVKGDVHGLPFDPGPVVGGDQLGVVALGHVGQGLHLALHVHHHGVHGAGDDGQSPAAGSCRPPGCRGASGSRWRSSTCRPAGCPWRPCSGRTVISFRLHGGHVDHLGQQRLMAVDDDVDVVLFQDAQVDLAGHRHRACRTGCPAGRWRSWSRPSRRTGRCGCTA